jgi:hypothetical protein
MRSAHRANLTIGVVLMRGIAQRQLGNSIFAPFMMSL